VVGMRSGKVGMAIIALVVIFLTTPHPQEASAYSLSLAPEAIAEAQAYGASRRTLSGELDERPWTRWAGLTESSTQGRILLEIVWVTPFLELARARASLGRPLNDQEIKDILEATSQRATVEVTVRVLRTFRPQDQLDARAVTMVVERQGGAIIRPTDITRSEPSRLTGPFLAYSGFSTMLRSGFRYSDGLEPGESVAVVVNWGIHRILVPIELGLLR